MGLFDKKIKCDGRVKCDGEMKDVSCHPNYKKTQCNKCGHTKRIIIK